MMYDSESFEFLKSRKIIIYGTGYVAMKLYEVLVIRGLDLNIVCFLVSKREGDLQNIKGIKVITIDEYNNREDEIICLAVHESIKDEIVEILNRKNILDYVWVHRYFLIELLFGKPIKKNIRVSVEKIIQQCENYSIAVRYLAIEQYYEKNDYGYDIYRKALRLHCGKRTAEKRLSSFLSLIQNWEKYGYKSEFVILINENNELLDGMHRVALAIYYQLDEVICDMFKNTSYFYEWNGSGVLIPKKKLLEADFTNEQLEIIEDTYKRIKGENESRGRKISYN